MKLYQLRLRDNPVFATSEQAMEYLERCRQLNVYDYDPNDKYRAARDIGFPFPYFEQGATFTLSEWIPQVRKECGSLVKDRSDEWILAHILTSSLWEHA